MDGAGKSQAFADALARARQLAAKLGAVNPNITSGGGSGSPNVGVKRGFDDYNSSEPDAKRLAGMADPFGAQLAAMKGMGGSSLAAGMGIKTGLGISGSGKACTEEIRIPDPLVGLIIGRGGEQINRIQNEASCKVQLAPDNNSGQDRPCYLQGTKEAIERAKEMVMEIVSSKSHEIGPAGGSGTGAGRGGGFAVKAPFQPSPGQAQVELMIPGSKVGLIIGKGGETIRNLQDKSGTKMFILQENMFEECDKPLRIVGEPDLVEHARQLVLELIHESPAKTDFGKKSEYGGSGSFGGPGMETMKFPVPKVSVGLIIGKGGDMIKRIQAETGAKVQFDPINSDMGDMDEQLAIITGKSEQIRLAQLKIEELVETALYGKNPSGDPRAQTERGKAGWDSGFGGKRDGEEERMSVPMGRVGMIIGKGGETIRTINQTSGAHCEIDRHGPQDGPDRTFVIRGTRQQIQHAKELITEKVNTFPPKGGRPGEYGTQPGSWSSGSYAGNEWSSSGSGDPSKMGDAATAAQWAAYYAQYYAQPQTASVGGEADYTQQWVEYLRAQGNHQQADLLEQQAKAAKGETASSSSGSAGASGTPSGSNGTNSSVDYSQQWAEHYRSIGKIQEAEAIEAYMKAQKEVSSGSSAGESKGGSETSYGGYYSPYGNGGSQKGRLTPPGES